VYFYNAIDLQELAEDRVHNIPKCITKHMFIVYSCILCCAIEYSGVVFLNSAGELLVAILLLFISWFSYSLLLF